MKTNIHNNPWNAFLPYKEEDAHKFKGRKKNVYELFELVQSHSTIVCYADSGIGKSSLINAGLSPLLRQNNYLPIKILFTESDFISDKNLAMDNLVIKKLKDAIDESNKLNSEVEYRLERISDFSNTDFNIFDKQFSDNSIWWLLHTHTITCHAYGIKMCDCCPIFIFDQFEEVIIRSRNIKFVENFFNWYIDFSASSLPTNIEQECKTYDNEIFHRELIPGTPYKFLFSLRQDAVGMLDYWCNQRLRIPSLKDTRYYLLPLTPEQAREIITKQGVDTLDDVADKIIEDIKDNKDDNISTLLLSVFCNRLYEKAKIDENGNKIKLANDDVEANKETLVRRFYEDLLSKTGLDKDDIKTIEDALVSSENGERRRIKSTDEQLEKVNFDKKHKELLSKHYIINRQPSGKDEYVEVSHDKLAEAIFIRQRERARKEGILVLLFALFIAPLLLLAYTISESATPEHDIHNLAACDEYVANNDYVTFDNKVRYKNTISFDIQRAIVYCDSISPLKTEFKDCRLLQEVVLSDSITYIPSNTIVNCPNLKRIKLPQYVEEIDIDAFNSDILEIDIDTNKISRYRWSDGILWDMQNTSSPIKYMQGDLFRNQEMVPFAFKYKDFDSIVFRGKRFYNLNRNNITYNIKDSILLPSPYYKYIEEVNFSGYGNITEISDSAFLGCKNIKKLLLPPNLRKIGKYAFKGCSGIDSLNLNNLPIKNIGIHAFAECLSLRHLELPQAIIQSYETSEWFRDCINLQKVIIPVSLNEYISKNIFKGCRNIEEFAFDDSTKQSITYTIKDGMVLYSGYPHFTQAVKYHTYNSNDYYSEDGILYYKIGTRNEIVDVSKNADIKASDSFKKRYGYYSANTFDGNGMTIFINNSTAQEDSVIRLHNRDNISLENHYVFLNETLNLREIHISNPKPSKPIETKHGIIEISYIIDIPEELKENIVLYVPHGCAKYYIGHPNYKGFRDIREDTLFQRYIDNCIVYTNNIISWYSKNIAILWLSILGIAVFVIIFYILIYNKLIEYRVEKGAKVMSLVFSLIYPISCFAAFFWISTIVMNIEQIPSAIIALFACIISLIILIIVSKSTRKELWRNRATTFNNILAITKKIIAKHRRTIIYTTISIVIIIPISSYYTHKQKYEKRIVQYAQWIHQNNDKEKANSILQEALSDFSISMNNNAMYLLRNLIYETLTNDKDSIRIGRIVKERQVEFIHDNEKGRSAEYLSMDGKYFAYNINNRIHVHNLETKSELKLKLNRNWVRTIRINADGNKILAYSGTKIFVLSLPTGEYVQTINLENSVIDLDFSPDGKYIATAESDTSIHIWDVATGKQKGEKFKFNIRPRSVSFSPDGKEIIATITDYSTYSTKVCDIKNGIVLQEWTENSSVYRAKYSQNGGYIIKYGTGTKIEKGGSTKFNLNGGAVEDIEVSPDEKYVAVATHNKVDIYDFDTQEKIISFNAGDYSSPGYRSSQTIEQIAFTPCGRYLLALTGNGILGKWNLDIPFDDSAVLELSNEMRLFAPLSNKDIEQLKVKCWLR